MGMKEFLRMLSKRPACPHVVLPKPHCFGKNTIMNRELAAKAKNKRQYKLMLKDMKTYGVAMSQNGVRVSPKKYFKPLPISGRVK